MEIHQPESSAEDIGTTRQHITREEFLDSLGRSEGDMMMDDLGREYVYDINEDGIKTKIYYVESD